MRRSAIDEGAEAEYNRSGGGTIVRMAIWRAGDPLRVWPQVQVEPAECVNGAGDGALLLLDGGTAATTSAVSGSAQGIGLHAGGGAIAAARWAPAGAGGGGAGDAWLVAHLTISDAAPPRVRSVFAAAALQPWLLSAKAARNRQLVREAQREASAAAAAAASSRDGGSDTGPRARRASDASAPAAVTSKARALLGKSGASTGESSDEVISLSMGGGHAAVPQG